jgi:hypothetical protein
MLEDIPKMQVGPGYRLILGPLLWKCPYAIGFFHTLRVRRMERKTWQWGSCFLLLGRATYHVEDVLFPIMQKK